LKSNHKNSNKIICIFERRKIKMMDIQARKIQFVQEFLRIADDELVAKLENLLRVERKKKLDEELNPMTLEELNEMIDNSEEDIKNGKVTEARNLLNQINTWK
jgi:hypothetical protein